MTPLEGIANLRRRYKTWQKKAQQFDAEDRRVMAAAVRMRMAGMAEGLATLEKINKAVNITADLEAAIKERIQELQSRVPKDHVTNTARAWVIAELTTMISTIRRLKKQAVRRKAAV